jgi:hypothetical protein
LAFTAFVMVGCWAKASQAITMLIVAATALAIIVPVLKIAEIINAHDSRDLRE